MNKQFNLDNLRHSCAHLLAAAVLKLWPETKRAIGPAIEDGFYFDFEFKEAISENDLPKIEAKMREILPRWKKFKKHMLSVAEAKKEYHNNPYKHEMIAEFSKGSKNKVSFYKSGDYGDLCKGGHVEHPDKELQHFKLLTIAGAYWHGDEKNKMLTRIYGTCFPTKKELDDYLKLREEAKKRDHRKIGKELELFVFSDLVGKGLPLFTEKGSIIRRELERFIVNEELRRGYKHVYTPDLALVNLYKKSGHYPYYKDLMYPLMKIDAQELILRPMTCPHHFQLYASKPRSYKELPLRIAELAKQFRYEKSGELTGLIRVRAFCLADAHIICTKKQATDEINSVLDLIEYVASVLGLAKGQEYRYRLSLGDRTDQKKYYKDDLSWDFAENVLRGVLKQRNSPYFEARKEAAFYGPKIDIQIKNVLGKEETAFTVQYDFVMPKRFDLMYTDNDGSQQQPIVIHRSSIGAIERVLAFLIEHFAGAFPVWLHPIQVKILPISDKFLEYAGRVGERIKKSMPNIRLEIDDSDETLGNKIRKAQAEKIPYMLIVGAKEEKDHTINLRLRTEEEIGPISVEQFVQRAKQIIDERSIEL